MNQSEINVDPLLYSNTSQCSFTAFDFVLSLGVVGGDVSQAQPKNVINLHLPPGHAKILAEILRANVAEFEKRNGKIPLPKEIEKEFGFK